jgi:hypothetical protein
MPEPARVPASTPIIRPGLPRVLWPCGRINRRIRRATRRLTGPLSPASIASVLETSPTASTGLLVSLIHTVPGLLASIRALLLHPALLLLLVFLLLEGELVLRGVSWSLGAGVRAHHTLLIHAAASLGHHGLHGHWVHAAGSAHHVLRVGGACVATSIGATAHHLRLHLLHWHWVHAAHGTHGGHAAGLLLGEVLLHLLEVLLHALPVLGHHGGGHAGLAALCLGVLLVVIATVVAVVAVVTLITVVELVVASELLVATIIVTHVASRLGTLDLDGLTEDLEWLAQSRIDSSVAIEGDETKTTRTTSLLVHHKGCINNSAELLEELRKVLLGCFLADTTNEDLACAFLLLARDRTLGVNLCCFSKCYDYIIGDLRSCHPGSAPLP